jgi:hypothetical protein
MVNKRVDHVILIKTVMFFTPTRREIFLVTVVFVILLSFSRVRFDYRSWRFHSAPELDATVRDLFLSKSHISYPENFRSKLSLTAGHIPETKVVAHAPGESGVSLLIIFHDYMTV